MFTSNDEYKALMSHCVLANARSQSQGGAIIHEH